jgi:hypothetical protein
VVPALTQAGSVACANSGRQKKKILSSLLFSLLKQAERISLSGSVELEEARGQCKREGRREEREKRREEWMLVRGERREERGEREGKREREREERGERSV